MAVVSKPGDIRFQTKTIPDLRSGDILIKVKASALCGSDLHTMKGLHPDVNLPTAIGHELSGEVIDCGEGVKTFKAGDRVCVEPLLACGHCRFCLRGQYLYCSDLKVQYRVGEGALAEYFVSPERWVYRLPETLSYEEACLTEPVAVALRAVRRSGAGPGDDVAVFGCGTVGLLIIQAARAVGVAQVFGVDILPHKLEAAQKFGAEPINASLDDPISLLTKNPKGGMDNTFEAVGLQSTFTDGIKALRKGGTLTVVGIFEAPNISLHASIFAAREISIVGSCAYCWNFSEALALMADGRINVNPLISHVLPLDELPGVLGIFDDKENPPVKIIFKP